MGAGPFFYGKKSPTPEQILSYAEGCPASAGLWIKKKQVVRTAQVLPVRGGGPCASTVVGASAAADTLQEPWTTVCTSIHRFSRSREGRPRRSRRDNIDSGRSTGGACGRDHLASWSVAAAFDRQGKAIGCELPARDERVCPPGGELSRVYGYRSFCPLGGRDGFACGKPLHRRSQRLVHLASRRLCGPYGPMLFTLHSSLCTFSPFLDNYTVMDILPRTC